jgi:poly(A) polymerase
MTQPLAPKMITKLKEYFSGLSAPAYLVGGYLRDSLLSLPPLRDVDIALSADSQVVGRDLALAVGGSFVPLSPDHGIARVVVEDSGAGPWKVDLVTLPGSIEEDLARRDFTIDALALPLSNWTSPVPRELVIDPFNGRHDLLNKCVRAVSPHVFRDDPGRLLRSVRLAASLRFRLEPQTARQVVADASHISRVALERVRDEFLAILALDGAKGSLEVLDRLDLLCRVVPELAEAKGVEQPQVHYWDVWGHLMHSVESAEGITKGHQHSPIYTLVYWTAETDAHFSQQVGDGHSRRTLLKLAALFHDIAKPRTKQVDETGRTRFPGHSETGAAMAAQRLANLRIGSRGVAMVSKMVEHHLRPGHMMQGVELPTQRAIYRYFRDLKDVAIDTLYLCQADYLAAKGPELDPEAWASHARMITHILQVGSQPVVSGSCHRLVDGNELMQHFKLGPGPVIGLMLDRVEEARAAGEIATREDALALVAQNLAQYRAGD